MDKSMKIALVISAVDSASRVISRMTSENARRLQELQNKTDSIAKKAFNVGKQTGVMGAAIAAPLVYATKQAIGFEESMAGVAKYANVDLGSKEFVEMGNTAKKLSVALGTMPGDTAELMQNLAGGGVALDDLERVTELAGKMGVAFDVSGEMAGSAFVKTKNALGLTIEETASVMDSINELGNTFASKSNELLEFMSLGGAGVANSMKAGGDAVAAFGSTLIAMGNSASHSATVMQAFTRNVMAKGNLRAVFEKAGGGAEGMFAVIEKGSKLSKNAQDEYFRQFGQHGLALQNLASNTGELRRAMEVASNETERAGSVNREFINVTSTTAAKMQAAKVQTSILAIEIGSALLPALNQILQAVTPLIQSLSAWMQQNPELVAGIAKTAAVVAGLLLSISAVSFAIGGAMKVFMIAAKAFMFLKTAISVVIGVFKVLAFVLNINPIVLIITAIAAAAYLMYKYWDEIKGFFVKLWDDIKALFWKAVDWVKEFGILFIGPIGFIIKYWDDIIDFFATMGPRFFEAGSNIISSIVEGIKSKASALVDTVKNVAQKVRDFFPFSPAKTGPLTDIHRVKLMETVAQSVKAAPLVNAVESAAVSARSSIGGAVSSISAVAGSGGGAGMNLTFAPEITINGAANETDILAALREYAPQMLKEFQRLIELNDRKSFT